MPTAEVKIVNMKGLHARASAAFAKVCLTFPGTEIKVESESGQVADGASIMDLLMLAAGPGTTLFIHGTGETAEDALQALKTLVDDGFGERD